jgi:hypothetical protein
MEKLPQQQQAQPTAQTIELSLLSAVIEATEQTVLLAAVVEETIEWYGDQVAEQPAPKTRRWIPCPACGDPSCSWGHWED